MIDNPSDDPCKSAEDFAYRYAGLLDYHVSQVMIDLGISPARIGAGDPLHGIKHAAFHPHDGAGGSVTPDGRIVVDSGILNPELLTGPYGTAAGSLWASARLKDRIEAIIAHEATEHETGSHESALKHAPDTDLPVSGQARKILRAMELGWKSR